ncbi:Bax inhibitor 1 like protein [Polystyrenella longa]|uniref:Bax inhibitor 1 like protein n=1 Tax=Polystyrenella longa TaxID=2528007 RepID=A0A518CM81_9PLAN|nr:Bax inhibitor-1/YccA family protein [Polystyrenella longa]QDU80339.1 Bax inhibitor 1 like protein [Polystyrenella longa]
MLRSSNPVFTSDQFSDTFSRGIASTDTMTVKGTAIKTSFLVLIVVAAGAVPWTLIDPMEGLNANMGIAMPWMIGGIVASLVMGLVIFFSPRQAPWAAPVYAIAEGFFVGAVSAWVQAQYLAVAPGIVFQAVCLTFGTLFAMMTAYNMGLIRATEKFKTGMYAAVGAVALVYLTTFVLHLFGSTVPYIHRSGPIGIGFSVIVVIIAALCLVLDFDFIEKGAEHGAPKYMEWYGAYGLLVTLVWLYIEILKLLMKLTSRD